MKKSSLKKLLRNFSLTVLAACSVLLPTAPATLAAPEECTANIKIIFYIDTSGSMSEEWNSVCGNIGNIVAALEEEGNTINYSVYGLGAARQCGTSSLESHEENWGPGTVTAANMFSATDTSIKIAVPISDECPYEGMPCNGQDAASINAAIAAANAHGVIVSPIISTNGTPYELGAQLAAATGGTISNASGAEIAGAITTLITSQLGDKDDDGHLSVACGGDDCDDTSSTIYPGTACPGRCAGNLVQQSVCSTTGECVFHTAANCENLGDPCRIDTCRDTTGSPTCVADISEVDFCTGLVPCGRMFDNPTTTDTNEADTCNFCHLALMIGKVINYLIGLVSALAVLALFVTGYMFMTAGGDPGKRTGAKDAFKHVLTGYTVVFLAWLIVDFVLSAWGFTDPLDGQWWVMC